MKTFSEFEASAEKAFQIKECFDVSMQLYIMTSLLEIFYSLVDRYTGGCRNSVLMQGDDYYGIDEDLCYFYENGWEERLTKATEEPFAAYLKRNPPKQREESSLHEKRIEEDCP